MESHEIACFQDGVAAILMSTEELRQSLAHREVDADSCLFWRHEMEGLMHQLFVELQPNQNNDDVERDLRDHCQQRTADIALAVLKRAAEKEELDEEDKNNAVDPEMERECQAAIARIAELNLILHEGKEETIQEVIETYASYQRQVLRQRAKPAIARLVAQRNQSAIKTPFAAVQEDDDDEEESTKSSHAHVITVILGQGSALIHPLIVWRSNLPNEMQAVRQLCTASISILDEQAQSLTKTVATWFLEDRKVDEWIAKGAQENTQNSSLDIDLAELDGLVEEMAFCCQVLARYVALIEDHTDQTSIGQELQPEWTWKYASLERYLTTQQWQSALELATPVHIVLGTPIQVPSVVEDAQYLSTRALERAASTRSTQAIGTVAHSIASDVWSTEIPGGVHQALLDQRGCWQEPSSDKNPATEPAPVDNKSGNSFAAALLGALDEDLSSSAVPTKTKSKSKPPTAPSSGTFLGTLSSFGGGGDTLQQIRLESSLCALNGIHSASSACSSLVRFLDSLLPNEEIQQDGKAATMIQLAREELFRFASTYKLMLQEQVRRVVSEWCGSLNDDAVYKGLCFPFLRYNLEREFYEFANAAALSVAEEDVRLEKQIIHPLQESKLLQQLEKCDSDVLTAICEEVATLLVELVLDCIQSKVIPKRFNDWGSLLFSKQARILENHVALLLDKASEDNAIPILPQWERLSQVVTVLQLERPSDWSFYQATSVLSADELQAFLRLRVDFSGDAIAAIVSSVNPTNR
jgi:hypothetical protein